MHQTADSHALEAALSALSEETGRSFFAESRYRSGETQATWLIREGDRRWILKLGPVDAADGWKSRVAAIEELRRRGYPAPRFELIGGDDTRSWLVQEWLPGIPGRLDDSFPLDEAMGLNALQSDLPVSVRESFWDRVVGVALRGGEGYCELASLRTYSAESARLADLVVATLDMAPELRTTDAVHYDFSPVNLLVVDGRISGVIDIGGVLAGDRAFDLVTLLHYTRSRERRALLRRAVLEITSVEAAAVYMAHIVLRQLDWSIRNHDFMTVAGWLGSARENLDTFEC